MVAKILFCFAFAFSAFMASGAEGDWPMWRYDTSLTGHQPLPGAMKKSPRVLAKYFIGTAPGTSTFADLRGTGKTNDVLVIARSRLMAYSDNGKELWQSAPTNYVIERVEWVEDLDGDGRNEVIAVAGHMGMTRMAYLILDAQTGEKRAAIEVNTGDFAWRGHCGPYLKKGKQIFIVTSTRQSETPGVHKSFGEFSMWSFDGRETRRHWAWTPSEFTIFYPAMMVADLNGDGRWHAVVDSWCHVWNIDLATGTAVSHTSWSPQGANERQYGWNELVDVDADGKLDFVNVSLTKHVDVLRNVGGKLQLGWTRGWPDPVTTEVHAIRPPFDPVADLDGDGRPELVTALFDGIKDKRWHLWIWNAATGEQKTELFDLVPMASVPLWGTNKGRALLCFRSKSVNYDPPENYEVWRLQNGEVKKIWESSTNAFVFEAPVPTALRDINTGALKVLPATTSDVDGDGRVEFFTVARGRTNSLPQAWGIGTDGTVVSKPGQPAPKKARALPKKIKPLEGTTISHLLAADLDHDKRNEVLLYDNTNITVLKLKGSQLKMAEKIPSLEVPVICNLLGDGKPCLLTSGRGTDGNLWIEARAADKKVIWKFVFPNSGGCGQYSDRPLYFTVGHFTGGKHLDVCTYSTKPSARTYVLHGLTGKPVWEKREMAAIERYYYPLGGRVTAWDYNKDGADDVIFCNPDYYCVADGRNADLFVGPVQIQPVLKWWAAYASPAILQNKDQEPFVYLGGAYSCRAAISIDGKSSLWLEYLPTERWALRRANAGVVEGLLPPTQNHGWRGGQVEADGTLVCYDAATGKHRWKMLLPTAASSVVSGDVNGDGRAEFLLGGQDGNLYVIRDAGDRGEILWRKSFDGPVNTPILADVNADGSSEIVVSVGDGFVYVLER